MPAKQVSFHIDSQLPFERELQLFDAAGNLLDLAKYEVQFFAKPHAKSTNAALFNFSSIRDTAVLITAATSTVKLQIPRAVIDRLKHAYCWVQLRVLGTSKVVPVLRGEVTRTLSPTSFTELTLFVGDEGVTDEPVELPAVEVLKGDRGDAGLPGIGTKGESGERGKQGLPGMPGIAGAKGEAGPRGPVGPMPRHQWEDTRLRFELPDGWGKWVDLQGPEGKAGRGGGGGGGGGSGPGTPGQPGRSAVASFTALAGEAITVGQPVNVYDNGGTLTARLACALSYDTRVIGYAGVTVAMGETVTVELPPSTTGIGLTVGEVFLSETPGQFTNDAIDINIGSIVQQVGFAISATEVILTPLAQSVLRA